MVEWHGLSVYPNCGTVDTLYKAAPCRRAQGILDYGVLFDDDLLADSGLPSRVHVKSRRPRSMAAISDGEFWSDIYIYGGISRSNIDCGGRRSTAR